MCTDLYSKKVYSYISFGPIFEGNDETIGIIGITGHVHLYKFLFSRKKLFFTTSFWTFQAVEKKAVYFK